MSLMRYEQSAAQYGHAIGTRDPRYAAQRADPRLAIVGLPVQEISVAAATAYCIAMIDITSELLPQIDGRTDVGTTANIAAVSGKDGFAWVRPYQP